MPRATLAHWALRIESRAFRLIADACKTWRRHHGRCGQPPHFHQLQELHSCTRVVAERAEHRAGDRKRILLFHPTHRHAQMGPLAHDGHSERIDLFANGFRDLVRHPLLDLEPPREDVDEPRNLAEADDALAWDIGNVALAEKGKQMVLAERVEIDVL